MFLFSNLDDVTLSPLKFKKIDVKMSIKSDEKRLSSKGWLEVLPKRLMGSSGMNPRLSQVTRASGDSCPCVQKGVRVEGVRDCWQAEGGRSTLEAETTDISIHF